MSLTFKEKVYRKYKKLQVESRRFTLPQSLSQAHNFLVCLPKKREEVDHVSRRLKLLTSFREGAIFSFSCDSTLMPAFHPGDKDRRVIVLHPDGLGFFSNPKRELRRRLLTLQAEVALDLDFGDNLTNALVCLESQAPLRLGVEKKNLGLPFYNLVIATGSGSDGYQETLDSFLEVVANLAGGRVV